MEINTWYGSRWKSTEVGGTRYGSRDESQWKSVEVEMELDGNQWK